MSGTKSNQEEAEAERRFQALLEYMKQTVESDRLRERALIEYGIQTLKWAFLMNAGTAGLVLAYISARSGQPGLTLGTILKTLWPFAAGCISVAMAGTAAYVNFGHASGRLPSPEALYNHVVNPQASWPLPKAAKPNETYDDAYHRIRQNISRTRWVAVFCGILSIWFFGYGVWRIIRLALSS